MYHCRLVNLFPQFLVSASFPWLRRQLHRSRFIRILELSKHEKKIKKRENTGFLEVLGAEGIIPIPSMLYPPKFLFVLIIQSRTQS